MKKRVHQLKEMVRGLFVLSSEDVVQTMNLVDTLQHLGIDHHFEEDISSVLRHVHCVEFNGYSLHHVALRFRLLREHGFWVSPGIYYYILTIVEKSFFLYIVSFQ
jgi:hypothetical protein